MAIEISNQYRSIHDVMKLSLDAYWASHSKVNFVIQLCIFPNLIIEYNLCIHLIITKYACTLSCQQQNINFISVDF